MPFCFICIYNLLLYILLTILDNQALGRRRNLLTSHIVGLTILLGCCSTDVRNAGRCTTTYNCNLYNTSASITISSKLHARHIFRQRNLLLCRIICCIFTIDKLLCRIISFSLFTNFTSEESNSSFFCIICIIKNTSNSNYITLFESTFCCQLNKVIYNKVFCTKAFSYLNTRYLIFISILNSATL